MTDVVSRPGRVIRRTVGEQAADYVRGLIVSGELGPGRRVPQAEIAEAFGISRTPLREALVILEREGWISIEAHRGAFVNGLDARTVADHYRLYGLLLGLAASLAIERGGPGLAGELTAIRDDFTTATEPDDRSRLAVRFNRLLVDAADSPRLGQMLKQMRGLPLEHYYSLVPAGPARQQQELDAVIGAVRERDGTAASEAYARLMADAGAEVIDVLVARGVIDADHESGRDTGPDAERRGE